MVPLPPVEGSHIHVMEDWCLHRGFENFVRSYGAERLFLVKVTADRPLFASEDEYFFLILNFFSSSKRHDNTNYEESYSFN